MNTRLEHTLRSLDAANPALTDEERQRGDELLDRIVETSVTTTPRPATASSDPGSARAASDPGSARAASALRSARASSAPRSAPLARLVLVPTAALALILAVVMFPNGGGTDAVYASWTATPTAVDEGDLEVVARACRRRLSGSMDLGQANLALAERRGDHVALLYRTDDPDMSGSCLATLPPGAWRARDVMAGAGGSSGPALLAPPAGFTQGAIAQYGEVSITDGAVGDQVVGVTIRAGDHTIEATVEGGRYVAWWPGPAFGHDDPGPSGEGGPEPILVYDLTLDDGTVITDAQPTVPS